MAESALTLRTLDYGTLAGGKYPCLTVTTLDAANVDGNYFTNSGRTFFMIKNTNAATCTVTFVQQTADAEELTQNVVVDVVQNAIKLIGPFNSLFNDVSNRVHCTYSAVTDVTVYAIDYKEKGRG